MDMFGKKKSGFPQSDITSLIGAGTRIEGNVIFAGNLCINGEVCGNISSENGQEGTLLVSEKAKVNGAISVGCAVINGTVNGPISAEVSLELLPLARVTGDIEYSQIEMQQGAVVQGRLVHQAGAKTVELKLASAGK